MRIGILTNNFSKLNRITRKLKNAEFNLMHLKRIPQIDHEIDVLVTDEIVTNCPTPHVVPGNLEILELKIRCAFYQKIWRLSLRRRNRISQNLYSRQDERRMV